MPSARETYRKILRKRASAEKAKQLAYQATPDKAAELSKRMKEAGKS